MGEICKTVEFPHPIEKVWRAMTDPKIIAAWLAENDFEPRIGHRFELKLDPQPGFDGVVKCEVLELDAPHTLAYSWVGGPIDTVVSYTLESAARSTTRLTLRQTGFRGLQANLVRMILSAGWSNIATVIGELLDRLDDDGVLAPKPAEPERRSALWRVLATIFRPFLKKDDERTER